MFKLPKEIKDGLKGYRDNLDKLLKGEITPARFKGVRVPWGIYSHRGGKVFMNRIRIPAAQVSAAQLRALAAASKKYGSGRLHITTRQDIQIHDVKIEDTIKVMEDLSGHDLSPRGGGGNTVRNVISCHLSGVCRDEIFDVRRYAVALTEYLLRREDSYNLPRKYKVSFSCCEKDCAGSAVNDAGLIAKIENGKKGFQVFTGGGMGASPRIGKVLEEFIPAEDAGYCVCAIKNIFFKKGDRRNKHHNRLRFLIEEMGFDAFKELYAQEVRDLKKKEHIVLRKIEAAEKKGQKAAIPKANDKEYNEFLKCNVIPQKQDGYSSVELRIPRGDISSEKLKQLAGLEKDFPGIEFRTTQNQNLAICWLRNQDLHALFLKLKGALDNFLYPNSLLDVVACKGAVTCNLGLCNSPALAKELERMIQENFIGKEIFKRLEIKLNGCPNACGQHPIGRLSFYGLVRRVDNRPAPFYGILLGGRKEGEKTRFGKEIAPVPARNLPAFLREFLKKCEGKIAKKNIDEFLEKEAPAIAHEVLEDHAFVPSRAEDRSFYVDWGRDEEFSLEGLGPGECGAGVLDMIESDLTESAIALAEAEKSGYSSQGIKRSLFLSARALQVVKGADPKNEEEALAHFREKFIEAGIASDRYADIKGIFAGITDALSLERKKEKFHYAREFLGHIKQLYQGMDSAFNFPARKEKEAPKKAAAATLDLKRTPCPLNYVKAKLYLENLDAGAIIEILLDEGEPMDNVPSSLKNDGHQILHIEKQDGFYKVVVKKTG